MYPRLSDLINDLLGTNILLPAKTFGFFLALSFVAAFLVLKRELARKERLGHFVLRKENELVEGPLPITQVILHALVWGLVGYKLGYMFVDAAAFSKDTEGVLLSAKGFWLTGLLAAGLAGGLRYREYAKRKDIKPKYKEVAVGPSYYSGTVVTIAFVAGILGSKIFAMLEPGSNFWKVLSGDGVTGNFGKELLGELISFNGLSFFGGLLTAGFIIIRYLYVRGFGVMRAVDAFAPCLILAYAVGRIGCQMSGDGDWGLPNELAQPGWLSWLPDWTWSYDYPHNVANEGIPIPGCNDDFCNVLPQKVWPTPFYETMMGLGIFGILMYLRTKFKYAGQMTSLYMILIGVERIAIESIRVNTTYDFAGLHVTQGQLISFFLIVGGAVGMYITTRRKNPLVVSAAS